MLFKLVDFYSMLRNGIEHTNNYISSMFNYIEPSTKLTQSSVSTFIPMYLHLIV